MCTTHLPYFFCFKAKESIKTNKFLVKKKPPNQINGGRVFKIGIDLLLRALGQLPSALSGLTALFGMGKGEPR